MNLISILKNTLDPSKPLFCDTETNHFFSSIKLFQCYQEHWSEALVFDIAEYSLQEIYSLVKGCKSIWHNYSYDAACFCNDLGIKENPFPDFEDTLILSRLTLYPYLEYYSLDDCLKYACGFDPYEKQGLIKTELQKSFISTKTRDKFKEPASAQQLAYAATDVLYLPKLYNIVKVACNDFIYLLDKSFIDKALKWQQNGMPVDKEALAALEQSVKERLEQIDKILPKELNINSYLQVRNFLHMDSSDDLALADAASKGNTDAALVREKRGLIKRLNFVSRYSYDRIKGYFNPTAVSGRVKCQGSDMADGTDNLMQIPRDLKGVFGFAESDPRYLVHADFAQLELRTLTVLLGDPVLIKLFEGGHDLHKYAAQQLYEVPESEVSKELRLMAKMCNFSLLYGSGANTFRNVLITYGEIETPDLETCKNIVAKWKKLYPKVALWHKDRFAQANNNKLIGCTLNGRHYRAFKPTDLLGIENQGLGAEVAKLSLHYLLKENADIKVLSFIHDAIILEAEDLQQGKLYAELLVKAMVKGWFEAIKNSAYPTLSMPLEGEVFKHLSDKPAYVYSSKGDYDGFCTK